MSSIQNSCCATKNFIEPALFVGVAFLAGSTRLIKYFPDSSRSGLLIAAGLTSTVSAAYDHVDHGFEKTLLRKVALVTLTAVCSKLIITPLNKRGITLSFQGAATLSAVYSIASAASAYWNQKSPLELQHAHYSSDIKAWCALEEDKRLELIKKFYEANLSPITPLYLDAFTGSGKWWDGNLLCDRNQEPEDSYPTDVWNAKLNSYTLTQLSWHREMVNCLPPILQDDNLLFFQRCEELGISFPELDIWNDSFEGLQDEWKNLLQRECVRRPLYYYSTTNLPELFEKKLSLPSLSELANKLDSETIEAMPTETLKRWYRAFKINMYEIRDREETVWSSLCESVRSSFLKRWLQALQKNCERSFYGDLDTPKWIKTLRVEDIQKLSDDEKERYFYLISQFPTDGIPFEVLYALNESPRAHEGLLTYTLTPEVVDKAETDSVLLNQLIKRGWNRGSFSRLPFASQKKLKALFEKEHAPEVLIYSISNDLISYLKEHPDEQPKIIVEIDRSERINSKSFAALTFENQRALKEMYKALFYFPGFYLSKELVATLQDDPELLNEIKKQLSAGTATNHYYGFFDLSSADQLRLTDLFGEDSDLLPLKITGELVAQLEEDKDRLEELLERLKDQVWREHNIDFGFFTLSQENQQKLANLFGKDCGLLPLKITHKLVVQLKENSSLLDRLIGKFENLRYNNEGLDERYYSEFLNLSEEDRRKVVALFGEKRHLLPSKSAFLHWRFPDYT